MSGAAIAPPASLVEKDKELSRGFPYEEDSRLGSQSSKAAISPSVYEQQDRPRSPTGPSNPFLANMGRVGGWGRGGTNNNTEHHAEVWLLGKTEQGLSTMLLVEKTRKRDGKIIMG